MALNDLAEVQLSSAVAQECFHHAYTTEREEVMGMLFGELVRPTENPSMKVARIWGSFALRRTDKRHDRVEISPNDLVAATLRAEQLTTLTGKPTRTIGWYHSHPHITPYPSHVDLASQMSYQSMETGWVGLIFAVFSAHGTTHAHTATIHSFRAGDGATHQKVPVVVVPPGALLLRPPKRFDAAQQLVDTMIQEMETSRVQAVEALTKAGAEKEPLVHLIALQEATLYRYAQTNVQPLVHGVRSALLPALRHKLAEVERAIAERRVSRPRSLDTLFDT